MYFRSSVIPRQDLPFLTTKSDVPGIYLSDAPAYTPEEFRRDAAEHGVEDEIAPPPPCLAINTVRDQYAPGDNMFAGTWLEAVPRDIRELIRCYWSSGTLPDSYHLAGVIAQIPALEQWYPNMMLTWEDGSRYRSGTDRSRESRSAQDNIRMDKALATCFIAGAAATTLAK